MRLAYLPLALVACAGAPPSQPAPPAPPPAGEPASPPAPTLPPGVLAEADGVRGRVRVDERDGLRRLLVGDVVQGAVPLAGAPLAADPLVTLLLAARPTARKALVIGLGTGRTAAELAASGLDVEVLELEPAVVKFAREHFDYRGHAELADGLTSARGRTGAYDLVLVDTLADGPPQAVADVFEQLGVRQADPRGRVLIGVRLRGSPTDPALIAAARRARYLQLWGAGAGDETQTLYALLSPRPTNIVAPVGIAAWPVPLHFEPHERPTVAVVADVPTARRVTLLGYLIRAEEDGALCLDLPHQEMGAQRYRLRGAALAQLEPLLPKKFKAMTAGEIGLDGDTSRTLREVLGGGGWMRSDVRFSPVIVALTGTARVAAVVDPDAAPFVPDHLRGDAPTDPRLPYGGVLYDLDVETVTWTLDRPTWLKLRPRLTALARQAAAALAKGDFRTTLKFLETYLNMIQGAFAEFAPRFAIYAELRRATARLTAYTRDDANTTAAVRGERCADLNDDGAFSSTMSNPDMVLLADSLERCADRLGP
jgi:hypothetical protein